jgi:hypothetical protein
MAFVGQKSMQKEQPLQVSALTKTVPLPLFSNISVATLFSKMFRLSIADWRGMPVMSFITCLPRSACQGQALAAQTAVLAVISTGAEYVIGLAVAQLYCIEVISMA